MCDSFCDVKSPCVYQEGSIKRGGLRLARGLLSVGSPLLPRLFYWECMARLVWGEY